MGEHMRQVNFGTVRERDIDFLLLEEICITSAFRTFLLDKVFHRPHDHALVRAERSPSDLTGETDVLMVVNVPAIGNLAVFIENKIDAIFQRDQALRYRMRGDSGMRNDEWVAYKTCLCAPRLKLEAMRSDWDACLPFEDVAAWFEGQRDPREAFRADLLRQAITKQRDGGFIPNSDATEFWRRYVDFCRSEFPQLLLHALHAQQSKNEPWPRFAEGNLPEDVNLEHKAHWGRVDLTIKKRQKAEVLQRISHRLAGSRIEVVTVGKSVALRIETPKVDQLKPFDDQTALVRTSLGAVQELLAFWPSVRGDLGFEGQS
jgi:hypothetical protein